LPAVLRVAPKYTLIHVVVYDGGMSRTNIDIDDELVAAAQRMYRLDSKRSAVDLALRRLVGEPLSRDEALALQGSGFDFTNDEVESFSAVEMRPADQS
jgi:Arc/MetJ family transcription regulator